MAKNGLSKYSIEMVDKALEYISSGVNTRDTAKKLSVSPCALMDWVHKEAHIEQYAHARRLRAEMRVNEIDQLKDKLLAGEIDSNTYRVLVDTIKWQAGKENRGLYGDKVAVESEQTLNVIIKQFSPPKNTKNVIEGKTVDISEKPKLIQ